MSDGEIKRRFDSIDTRLDRMVPIDMWNRENEHTREKFDDTEKANEARFERIEERGQNVWIRGLGVLGIAATLFAAVLAAYLSSRGAH